MASKNYVFIATSIDGYIAEKDGGIAWLDTIPNPDSSDMGYVNFINNIDAIIMGRLSFEKILSFGIEWPYEIPVLVLSTTLINIPKELIEKVDIISGTPQEIIKTAHSTGLKNLYIDGGKTVQNFLKEDLIDEMIITTIPILLGSGIPLFSEIPEKMEFEHIKTDIFLKELVQRHYSRKR